MFLRPPVIRGGAGKKFGHMRIIAVDAVNLVRRPSSQDKVSGPGCRGSFMHL
ncbi:MAG: hypothetical protein WCX27_00230 [Candidatus Paceibacterota bacterium]